MSEYHVPKGVSAETLREIVAGWAAVGAAAEPQYTSDVEEATDISDAVGRQTRFLEDVGILRRAGQQHELTDEGRALAGALMAEDPSLAAERTREILDDWELTEQLRGILRQNPMDRADVVPILAGLAGADLSASRVRSGITTLLDLFEWAGILDRDDDERYRLPAQVPSDASSAEQDSAGDRKPTHTDERESLEGGDKGSGVAESESGGGTETTTQHHDEEESTGDGDGVADGADGPEQAVAAHESAQLPVPDERTAPDRPVPTRQRSDSGANGNDTDEPAVTIPAVRLDVAASDSSTPAIEFVPLSDGSGDADIALGEVATAVSEAIGTGTANSENRQAPADARADGEATAASTGSEGDGDDAATDSGSGPSGDGDERTEVGTAGGRQGQSRSPAISLGVDVDADAEDLESIVAAIRRGLVDSEND